MIRIFQFSRDARLFAIPGLLIAAAYATASAQIPVPTPLRMPMAQATITPADTNAILDSVPAFRDRPLMHWGPLPPGTVHEFPPLTYDLRNQVTSLRFDWPRHAVVGTTTLYVAALAKPLTAVSVDAVDMQIKRVVTSQGGKVSYEYDGKRLKIQLPRAVPAQGRVSVTIDYEALDRKQGAYFIDRTHYLWTQGETEEARYWIPTNDRPDDKATWEISVVTDTGERALSNGRLASSKKVPGGIQWRWIQEKPASTYLMSVVTGKYTVIRDHWKKVPVNYWTYPDSVEAGRRGFGKTPSAIEIFSRKTGVPYPWAKYDQSVVPDFKFGGMENVTATTQNDNSILHPAWAEPESNADGLMAHELGHQWFGDLLTTKSWPHVWLNEGFATFMEQIYREEAKGVDEGALDRLGAQNQTIDADRRARRPIVYDRWVDDAIEVFFSGHIYPKGATVLQTLRHQFGDSLFWAAIHNYTVKHAYGNVVTEDLRAAFEQTTGADLKPFFAQWIYGAGFPVYRVSYSFDSTTTQLTLQARETQATDSLTGHFDADIPVEARTETGVVSGIVQMRDGEGRTTLTLDGPPRSIRWNKGKWFLELTDFPRPTRMLMHQLAHDDDVLGRVEAIDALRTRLKEPTVVEALAAASAADPMWAIRMQALQAVVTVGDMRATMAARAALDDRDSRVRTVAAQAFTRLAASIPDIVETLGDLAQHDPSYYVRGAALASYLVVKGDDGVPLAEDVMAIPSWRDVVQTPALQVLKGMSSPAAQALYAKYVTPQSPAK